jgi:SAM-dependent methyltransferase
MAVDPAEMKQRQRAMWAAGDYPDVASYLAPAAEDLLERLAPGPGDTVLDVATGSGNAAVVAARRGANVTGLDLTPELLPAARRRAEAESLQIEFVEGDAEDLPFADGSFECVTSVFGVMFAPRQEIAAAELVRVCRPGGTIAVTAWTPEGANGQMFAAVGRHLPPPPPGFVAPVQWGVEEHVRGLLEPLGVEVEFSHRSVVFAAESVAWWVSYNERVVGPIILAKAALEPDGRYEAFRADLTAVFEQFNDATDGSMRVSSEYLVTIARRPG